MARVVYGVSGEGSGHSSRSREMIRHLLSRGHEVKVVTYGRGVRDLGGEFPVFETEGLSIATVDNRVSPVRTLAENLARLPGGTRKYRELKRLFRDFEPHAVITDFEPMTAHLAAVSGVPLVTLDNQHRIRYMDFPCPARLRGDAAVTLGVIRSMVPRPDVSLVTTFFFGSVRNDRTFLFPPILGSEVRDVRPADGGHLLVYLTRGFESLVERLRAFSRERFLVYGTQQTGQSGPLTFKPPGRESFLGDLASCRAVLATAGFTLMTEALHLGKPFLAFPMKGQFEQELNALLLADLGYGKICRRLTAETVGDFLYRLPEYRDRLADYPRADNSAIKRKLDELLADDAALARQLRRRRPAPPRSS